MIKTLAIILVIALGLTGLVVYYQKTQAATNQGCTLEALICPDGSAVGREGKNCEFTPCPTTSTNINITQLSPDQGKIGDPVTITGSSFPEETYTIKFGEGYIYNATKLDETSLTFTVPDGYELCPPNQDVCPEAYPPLQKGMHEVQVIGNSATSNTLSFEVL